MKQLLSAQDVQQALERLYRAVLAQLPDEGRVAVVGIRTRGEVIARRVAERIRTDRPDLTIDFGVLDITFYRDDLALRRRAPLVRATEIDFDLDDCWLLLVDDVLQTGRSIRAALDAIHDFGRPRTIRLAVLVDRGGRELPIAADCVGCQIKVDTQDAVRVKLQESDGEEGLFIQPKED